jgi:hypothetical protein
MPKAAPLPWFRFYHEALDDPKIQTLPPDLFKHWVNLLCLCCRNDGLPTDLNAIGFALRIDVSGGVTGVATVCERLCERGLLDKLNGGVHGYHYAVHGWDKRQYKSDTSTDRVKRFRKRFRNVSETVSVTGSDTDTDTENPYQERTLIYQNRARV